MFRGNQMGQQPQVHDCIHIMVPNSSVGAIIGSGGVNIKKIIRESNAFVTVSHEAKPGHGAAVADSVASSATTARFGTCIYAEAIGNSWGW